MNKYIKYGLAYAVGAYIIDVMLIPAAVAKQAREHANKVGRPMLNIGAGTPGSSLRVALLGPTLWGDVNIDIAADKSIPAGPNTVSYGDGHKLSQYPDGYFGAVTASHVLEHMDNPIQALSEWMRLVGNDGQVLVTVPKWWAPHTWLHPGHKWYVEQDGTVHKIKG